MRNREQAARAAEATVHNVPGFCQGQVSIWFDAPVAGDYDGDGAADAEDGWKKEPLKYRHTSKDAPRGVPGAALGGSHDNGHRFISLGGGIWRSTDFNGTTNRYERGICGNGTVDQICNAMGVVWAGWSETMNGVLIPMPPPPSRGAGVDKALAEAKTVRKRLNNAALAAPDGTPRDLALKKALVLSNHLVDSIKNVPFIT